MGKRKRLLQEYEIAVEEIKRDLEKKLSYHEKNPENHPKYPDEWKKFWNRRFKELQMEGKDPSTYDFKPEWILSWSKRMQEIHIEEMGEKMSKLRDKMFAGIDMDKSSSESPPRNCSPIKDRKPGTDLRNSRYNNHLVSEAIEKDSDIVIKSPNDKKPRVTGASPINSDSEDSISAINDHNKPREKIHIENPLNVITVLRQLSVLENQLGLLAPKIVDLLSEGLLMEKIEPKSSIKLLTPENCVMFETVKEKLKGQLLAGVVKRSLVNATMFSIRNIEKLMQLAPKFVPPTRMLTSATVSTPISTPALTPTTTPAPVIVPGVGAIDKISIAQQITQALLAQGRENVTQEELETLINAVVGMAKDKEANNLLSNINNGEMLKTVNVEINKKKEEVEKKNLDQLSQVDIINLLKNFRDLTTDEQDGLITYLKDLWEKSPEEVKKLRKYIDMGPSILKEVTSMFKEEEDDDNYELSEVCKAVKEKVSEQKNDDLNKIPANFEITEEHQKILNSLQNFLPKLNSNYSLNPINSQVQPNPSDSLFYINSTNESCTPSYSLDQYSVKKTDASLFPSQSSTSTPFVTALEESDSYNLSQDPPANYHIPQELSNKPNLSLEHPDNYNTSLEQHNKFSTSIEQSNEFSMPLDQTNKYNIPLDQPNEFNTLIDQPNFNITQDQSYKYNKSQEEPGIFTTEEDPNKYDTLQEEQPDPYSANQIDNYNDPYSQNRGNSYYQRQQQDSYYQYQKNPSGSYPATGGYYKGNNTFKTNSNYKGNNTYTDTYQGTSKINDRNNQYNRSHNNRSHNNRFQNKR